MVAFLYLKNNVFTRNIGYLEGNAIFIGGGQSSEPVLTKEKRGLWRVLIDDCTFEQNFGINVAFGGTVAINGRQKAPS
jgi:hypothetical protein